MDSNRGRGWRGQGRPYRGRGNRGRQETNFESSMQVDNERRFLGRDVRQGEYPSFTPNDTREGSYEQVGNNASGGYSQFNPNYTREGRSEYVGNNAGGGYSKFTPNDNRERRSEQMGNNPGGAYSKFTPNYNREGRLGQVRNEERGGYPLFNPVINRGDKSGQVEYHAGPNFSYPPPHFPVENPFTPPNASKGGSKRNAGYKENLRLASDPNPNKFGRNHPNMEQAFGNPPRVENQLPSHFNVPLIPGGNALFDTPFVSNQNPHEYQYQNRNFHNPGARKTDQRQGQFGGQRGGRNSNYHVQGFSDDCVPNSKFEADQPKHMPSNHFQNKPPNLARSRNSSLTRSTHSLNSDLQESTQLKKNNRRRKNNKKGTDWNLASKGNIEEVLRPTSQNRMQLQNPALGNSNNSIYSNPGSVLEGYGHMGDGNRPDSRSYCYNPVTSGTSRGNNKIQNKRGRGVGNRGGSNRGKQNTSDSNQRNNGQNDSKVVSNDQQKPLITLEQVESLAQEEPMVIVQILSDNDYSMIFDGSMEPKMLILVVNILRKVCSENQSSDRAQILRRASLPEFLHLLYEFISDLPYTEDKDVLEGLESFYEDVIKLYDTFSDFLPSAVGLWRTHLVEVKKSIKAVIKNLNIHLNHNLLVMVESLLDDIKDPTDEGVKDNVVETKAKKEQYFPDPVGDFRTVPLYPRPEDVYGEQPFLYPNVIEGPYRSVEHYLDTHFKLLREDFMSPIRQAIRDYKRQQNSKEKFKRIDNVRIYRKVKFLHPKTITDKVGYEVCFDVDNKINRVNWEFSNRFMFGSLLLFSNDDFDTFFLATVANRNVKELEKKLVVVELVGAPINAKSILGKQFIMAESEAYFEPYYHVLKALQMFDYNNFPMARYIVGAVTYTAPPNYLSDADVYTINMANNYFRFRVLSDIDWPNHEELGLDVSQHEAYKAALTNDLVVIQGPPGTGKTFLGLKIAHSLLLNAEVWNQSSSPILVVCFTNHALDQFLEGLLPVTSKLVRIGGRSKGSELDKFNIRERRREYSYYKKAKSRESRELHLKMSTVFAEMKTYQTNVQLLDDNDGVLSAKTLELVMPDNQREYFRDDDHLMDWLLVGSGNTNTDKKVKITITADGGVVKQAPVVDPLIADADDQRIKQAFLDVIDIDTNVLPSEDTVKVHFACNLDDIQRKQRSIKEDLGKLDPNNPRNRYHITKMQHDNNNLDKLLTHLRKELSLKNPVGDVEKQTLLNTTFLDGLQPSARWKLYHIWVDTLRSGLIVELGVKEAEFRQFAFQFEQLRQADDIQILKTSHVVGTTTTIAAKLQPVLTALAPKIVIVEEAAEVLEAHIIASLTQSCQHLILIGDHKQLRPNIAEVRLARQYKLDVSLFERMVRNGMACHTLTLQHRMRPEISKQLVPTIYPILRDDISVQGRERIKGMAKNVFFLAHNHFEDDVVEITSKRNRFEAAILLRLARYLVLQGYKPQEITILATYKGQMYHMKNELKNIDGFPKGIQITVVDNFQGEENRIILLSLVRSNQMKKIGFLEIENRVCVALSRARDGLYIVGNMDNLVASSEIWPHIKRSLVQQEAYGPALKLHCERHPEQETLISCEKDFSKVAEGGCSQICGEALACGHFCKAMCHVSQDYHQWYKCREPCPKVLCQDGHLCPKKCHQKCGDCQVTMHRQLVCGHFADVPCHLDIRQCKCLEPVEVVVASCGHTVTVPCHTRLAPECTQPCVIRLECGHSCDKLCHVNDDPDHLEYICMKPCPRKKKDCSEDHKCEFACFEPCQPCNVKVRKQLPCVHMADVLCSTDLTDFQCKRKCVKTLACGHLCAKKCWEPCEPCPVIVEKTVNACGHVVKVACSQPPSKDVCEGPCPVVLPCSHPCAKRCKDPCSVVSCEHLVDFKFGSTMKSSIISFLRSEKIQSLLCGHKNAKVPCNKTHIICAMSPEELMQYCAEPCEQPLTCNHVCSGSCSECMQGRIHKVCDQPCGNVLICGHSCRVPCREACPPCNQPCKHQCKHSKCNRKCGEPCVPCKEPCDYECPHVKCKKQCGELCDRMPCYEPCPKRLVCMHPCVGYCGEPCPPCKQCEPSHFEEFFYTGEETEPDAKWIYLEDCRHTFESSGLEHWLNMKQEGSEIVSKSCPRCKTSIVKVQRFMNLIKETYIDIQKVKTQCYGKTDEIKRQRMQSLRKLQQIQFVKMSFPENEPDRLQQLYEELSRDLPEVKMKRRNAIDAQKVQLLCFLTEFFVSLYERKVDAWGCLTEEAKTVVTKKVNFLTELLQKRKQKISEQEMKSFECELKRIHRLCDLFMYKCSTEYRMSFSYSGAKEVVMSAEKIINSLKVYDDAIDVQMINLLKTLKEKLKISLEITNEEKAMINKAMGSSFNSSQKTGHWFKCKNGHVYCITECGGAMEEATCPIKGCGERIGGRNHALRQDQALATEMDGATYAAWSDRNNMANYNF